MMKKYISIFTLQTLVVTGLSLVSCYISLRFQFRIYADFLIIGIIIVFPLTFTMREAFRRRERSLQYLSLLKASLQSTFYTIQNTKMEAYKKAELELIAYTIPDKLIRYLTGASEDIAAVQQAFYALITFIQQNKKETKNISVKILLFMFRINESIEYLLAVKRHHTPWGPKAVVLFTIYLFVIFYPAAILYETGFNMTPWNLYLMTGFKAFILISLYNVQVLMEDPFNELSPDGIMMNDFRFNPDTYTTTAPINANALDPLMYKQKV